jgi:hypothetical protein
MFPIAGGVDPKRLGIRAFGASSNTNQVAGCVLRDLPVLLGRIVTSRVTRFETSAYINRMSSQINAPDFNGFNWYDASLTHILLRARYFGYTCARIRHSKGDS